MSSDKQIAANRTNARRSTGPRTEEGKARSVSNSRKHGLTLIQRNNPAFAARIEAIARGICEDSSNPLLLEQALIMGETTCVLDCVRALRVARMQHLHAHAARPSANASPSDQAGPETEAASANPGLNPKPNPEPTTARDNPLQFLASEQFPIPELDPLWRYERRALSRRNRAFHKYLELRDSAALASGTDPGERIWKRGFVSTTLNECNHACND